MCRGITIERIPLRITMGRSGSIVGTEGVEVLALKEIHLMDDGKSDDNYTPEELLEVVNN